MGLMDAFRSMRMKDPIDVDAQVVSTTAAPDGATHGTAVMNLVVQLPGMEAGVDEVVQALREAMPGAQIQVGSAGEASAFGSPERPGAEGEDRVAQLERLARLRDAGALTEQEFEREKARILGA